MMISKRKNNVFSSKLILLIPLLFCQRLMGANNNDTQFHVKIITNKSNGYTVIDSTSFGFKIFGNSFRIINFFNVEDINTKQQSFYKCNRAIYYKSNIENLDSLLIINFDDTIGVISSFKDIFQYPSLDDQIISKLLKDTLIDGSKYYKLLFEQTNNSGNFKTYLLLDKEKLLPYYFVWEYYVNLNRKKSSVEYYLR